jgi:acetyltransferase-like isoleucine patch superfamily enzyme
MIDDNCLLDAKGIKNKGIRIGNGVFLGRNSILSCKEGDIVVEDNVNIGFNCEVVSLSKVSLGKNTMLAAYAYVIGGGHKHDRHDIPILDQDRISNGISIGEDVWLGAGSRIMDGTKIGNHSIIGANAVVTKDIPEFSIAVGIPAKVTRDRRKKKGTMGP